MPEGTDHPIESSYRFIDDGREPENSPDTDSPPLSVEFYPSVEDYVWLAEVNANRYPMPAAGRYALMAFVLLNAFGLPVVLFYLGYLLPALIVFGLNLALSIYVIPALFRVDHRRYFFQMTPDLEECLIRVELYENGVSTRFEEDSSFHSWKSITSVEVSQDAIFFMLRGGQAIIVRKSGFPYEQDLNRFVAFAHERVKLLPANNETGHN